MKQTLYYQSYIIDIWMISRNKNQNSWMKLKNLIQILYQNMCKKFNPN